MSKIIGLVAVLSFGSFAITEYGGMFGLTADEKIAIQQYKDKGITKAAAITGPVATKQDYLAAEAEIRKVMPTEAEVIDTMDEKVVPAVINTANKLGKSATDGLAQHSKNMPKHSQ